MPLSEPSPKWARPIEKSKLLVVEGPDDQYFLSALLQHLGIETDFDIRYLEGTDNFNRILRAFPGVTGFGEVASLALVRDADQDAQSAFQSICSALENARLSVPKRPFVSVGEKPEISVFIWPDCKSSGTLETLCLSSASDDPAIICIEQYFECLARQMATLPKPIHKAHLHTFLASREKPGLRLGEAANAGYWPWEHPVFDPIIQFLRAL
jgi:hypothetical protein